MTVKWTKATYIPNAEWLTRGVEDFLHLKGRGSYLSARHTIYINRQTGAVWITHNRATSSAPLITPVLIEGLSTKKTRDQAELEYLNFLL